MTRESLTLHARMGPPIALAGSVPVVGSLGFYLSWQNQGATFWGSIFMAVITITAVGYGKVYLLGRPGCVWAILVAFTGVGGLFSAFRWH